MWSSRRKMHYIKSDQLYRKLFSSFRRFRIRILCLIIIFSGICIAPFMLLLSLRSYDTTEEMNHQESRHVLEPVQFSKLHDKWIVVTSAPNSLSNIEKLADVDDWKVLVVGERNTSINLRHRAVVYLSHDDVRNMSFGVTQGLPYNEHTRRLAGYLYAIYHGALYIYDVDDGCYPADGHLNFNFDRLMTGLIHQDTRHDVLNPYAHFGRPSIWPRGYPLDAIKTPAGNTYTLCKFWTPCIQQSLVDGDADVDAIFRLTKPNHAATGHGITFDSRAPPLAVSEGIFVPINSKNTLFKYEAFWALFTPASLSHRASDISRGYWAQRLVWLLGQKSAVFPPNVARAPNVREYANDIVKEMPLYVDSGRLVTFLKRWQCSRNVTFFQCVVQLSRDMVEADFWSHSDAELLLSWLRDLKRIEYHEPFLAHTLADNEVCVDETHARNTVYYSPNVQAESAERTQSSERAEKLAEFCGSYLAGSTRRRFAKKLPKLKHDNILLIVVLDKDMAAAETIRMLDNLYYDHFPHIAYCGETTSYDKMFASERGFGWVSRPGVTIINMTLANGYFSYECAMRAMEMDYAVDGYLVLDGHVLFNFWNLNLRNHTAAYQKQPNGRMNRYTDKKANDTWRFWSSEMGYSAVNRALDETLVLYQHNGDPLVGRYLENIYNKYLEDQVGKGHADLYYIPSSTSDVFVYVIDFFFKLRVFVEFAIPTIVHGLHPYPPAALTGANLDEQQSLHWTHHYNASHTYLHPVKLTNVLHNADERKLYCTTYVKDLLNNAYNWV